MLKAQCIQLALQNHLTDLKIGKAAQCTNLNVVSSVEATLHTWDMDVSHLQNMATLFWVSVDMFVELPRIFNCCIDCAAFAVRSTSIILISLFIIAAFVWGASRIGQTTEEVPKELFEGWTSSGQQWDDKRHCWLRSASTVRRISQRMGGNS